MAQNNGGKEGMREGGWRGCEKCRRHRRVFPPSPRPVPSSPNIIASVVIVIIVVVVVILGGRGDGGGGGDGGKINDWEVVARQ
jgi:hypothetical protein